MLAAHSMRFTNWTSSRQHRRVTWRARTSKTFQAAVDGTSTTSSPADMQLQPSWQACVCCIQDLGFSQQEAEQYVQRAFGHGTKARAFWRHEKRDQPADLQQVQVVLQFLLQLGMTAEQVFAVVKAFPEVLGCDVQTQLQKNVDKLQKEWRLQDGVLVKAVLRNPAVLGYNVDCEGDCAGECNRCWARF